ncbi:MAG: hypothetical protein EPO06_10100 [Burkholderiaceae bacterium]|nr:MAG: hypothetical protein EPO06_10100 [Burkholderiaceae bacterium]
MMLLRRTWKIVKWLLLIAVACILLVILINLFDRKPSPAAVELAKPFVNTLQDRDNAYLYMLGFDADKNSDPIDAGRRRLDKYNQANALGFGTTDPVEPIPESHINIEKFCNPLAQRCLQEIRAADQKKLRATLTANAHLLGRYRTLQKFQSFEEQAVAGPHLPNIALHTQAQNLFLTEITAQYIGGKREEPLQALEMDIRFNRLVFEQSRSLIMKMIATVQLHKNYRLLGEFIADMRLEDLRRYEALIARALIFSESSLDMSPAIRYENDFIRKVGEILGNNKALSSLPEQRLDYLLSFLTRLVYNRQDFENQTAKWVSEYMAVSRLKPHEWVQERAALTHRLESMAQPDISWAYNPIGRISAWMASTSYVDYIDRVFDLYAMNRLVGASWKIRLMNTGVSEANKKLPTEWCNPYTGLPFDWNGETRELGFDPLHKRADRKYSLSL